MKADRRTHPRDGGDQSEELPLGLGAEAVETEIVLEDLQMGQEAHPGLLPALQAMEGGQRDAQLETDPAGLDHRPGRSEEDQLALEVVDHGPTPDAPAWGSPGSGAQERRPSPSSESLRLISLSEVMPKFFADIISTSVLLIRSRIDLTSRRSMHRRLRMERFRDSIGCWRTSGLTVASSGLRLAGYSPLRSSRPCPSRRPFWLS